jgi:hypothetical protein
MFFSLFLLADRRIRIRIRLCDYWIRIREAQKHMDPMDPDPDSDPQNWQIHSSYFLLYCFLLCCILTLLLTGKEGG